MYSTAKLFAALVVTDADGNIACGISSSFSNFSTGPAAYVPTFTRINSNAASALVVSVIAPIQISLTTPFIYIPTRVGLQINPTEACAQGNGTENYGYPVQQGSISLLNSISSWSDFS